MGMKKKTRVVKQETKQNTEISGTTMENDKASILDGILDILLLTSKKGPSKLGEKEERKLINSSDNNLSCDQCNKSFRQRTNLQIHKKIHLGLKPFKCKHCDKEFSQKSNMKVHEQRRHRKEGQR